jgi:hypothetical protein
LAIIAVRVGRSPALVYRLSSESALALCPEGTIEREGLEHVLYKRACPALFLVVMIVSSV